MNILYGELTGGTRARGHSMLRFRDVCKRHTEAGVTVPRDLERIVRDRDAKQLHTIQMRLSKSVCLLQR